MRLSSDLSRLIPEAADVETASSSVETKVLIGQVRKQVQNLESAEIRLKFERYPQILPGTSRLYV